MQKRLPCVYGPLENPAVADHTRARVAWRSLSSHALLREPPRLERSNRLQQCSNTMSQAWLLALAHLDNLSHRIPQENVQNGWRQGVACGGFGII